MFHINVISKPKISIITIVLNGAKTIEQTINSVIGQTAGDIEYIIIDGGSTDETIEIIKKYAKHIDVFVSEPDTGIGNAFNKGVLAASGEIIGIINADDWYEETAVADVIDIYGKYPYYDVYYGKCNFITLVGTPNIKGSENGHLLLLDSMNMAHPSTFVKRDAYLKYGLFNEDYRIAMDYEWLLRAYVNGAIFRSVDALLAHHRPGGISQVNYDEAYAECSRARNIFLNK
ncbi:Glycosyl transferase family 2 [Pedobacter steynii]|uniref:Glycosyl transferase family 2 n=1 Tax=Pedobacter steynii TaxID=430522 RepID=A0A1G9UP42_9SPHI|nr:glycosyltransferase family 2 protein [Pedobacter steynii]NQX40828.1 glycosyltransferase [Pedobacter steynii]SDM61633.1 Glycosyl transferase family 2 [Pedobacter steynii]